MVMVMSAIGFKARVDPQIPHKKLFYLTCFRFICRVTVYMLADV